MHRLWSSWSNRIVNSARLLVWYRSYSYDSLILFYKILCLFVVVQMVLEVPFGDLQTVLLVCHSEWYQCHVFAVNFSSMCFCYICIIWKVIDSSRRKMEQNNKSSDKKSLSFMFVKVATENATIRAITLDFFDTFVKI